MLVALYLCESADHDDHVVRYLAFELLGVKSAGGVVASVDGLTYRRADGPPQDATDLPHD